MYLNYLSGTSGNMFNTSFYIDSNEMTAAYAYGIYVYYYSAIQSVCRNRIQSRFPADSNQSVDYYGLYSYYFTDYDMVQGNVINVDCKGNGYGMYLYYNQNRPGSAYGRGLIVNNDVRVKGISSAYGIYYNAYYSQLYLHHNSVYAFSENGVVNGLWLKASQNTSYVSEITRNLVTVNGKSACPLFISSAAQYCTSFYCLREWNNWYANDTVANVNGSVITTISDLETVTGNDANSSQKRPVFTDATNNLELDNLTDFHCPMHADVARDINGLERASVTSMGAYDGKYYGGSNLWLVECLSPVTATDMACVTLSPSIAVTVKNTDKDVFCFDSSALKVSLDVTGAITLHWDTLIRSGQLASGRMDTLTLGSLPTLASGTYHIRVTLSDSADVNAEDDTLSTDYTVRWIEPPYDVNFTTVPAELISVIPSGSIGWKVVQGAGTAPAVAPAFGTGRLEFAGAGNPGASANAVFNGVNLHGCLNPKLSFWYAHDAADSKRDLMFVLATTDGGATYTEIGRITAAAAVTGWQQYDIDLSRFANASCLSIVFQAISFGGADQSIDRIRISADADAAITLLPVELGTLTACNNDAV
ncbi:MAG: hypothetical protein J6S82_04905, partial [Bacteroidales bacterium]|nr:hypothetical protein [Bacteroidales bacterium]